MNDNEQLDNILNNALAEYREAEPLAGLEDRVLQRLRLQPETRRFTWWKWAAVAACAATLTVVIWIEMSRRTPQTGIPLGQVAVQPNVVPIQREPAPHTADDSKLSQVAPDRIGLQHRSATISPRQTRANAPMAAVFPIPVPLTPEEQAFATALDRHPDARPMPSASDAAPVIAKIEIKPLSDSDKTPGENQ